MTRFVALRSPRLKRNPIRSGRARAALIAALLTAAAATVSTQLTGSLRAQSPVASPAPAADTTTVDKTPPLPEQLVVRWEFKADEAIETSPLVADGRVFVADVMGKVYAIDQASGKELWSHDYETGFLAAPAIQGDLLVIGDVEGNLYAIDAKTGQQQWKQSTDGEINGSASFYRDQVLVTSQDGKLYSYAAADGNPQWTYQTDDQIRCSPTIAGDQTFLGGCDGQLHVVDLKTGKAVGQPMPLGGPTGSTPVIRGDRAFLPIMDGAVMAFDWNDRQQLWRYEDDERAQEYRSSAAVSDNLVVVSSQYKQVDALAIDTGQRVWRHTLRRRADASPVIAGDDVFVAATDGRLIRLALADGIEKDWSYEIRGSFLAAPTIADQMLFIADDQGVVRCFAGPSTAPAAAAKSP